MNHELVEFRIKVQPSPETSGHEVCLLADGENLIERFSSDMIGLDPDDLLVEPCPLRAQETPHTATIGRCTCGGIGCGSVEVAMRDGKLGRRHAGGSTLRTTPSRFREGLVLQCLFSRRTIPIRLRWWCGFWKPTLGIFAPGTTRLTCSSNCATLL
jgi:hypothetical protein